MKNTNQDTQKEVAPVMKQLARPMTKEELAIISGAGCAPSSQQYTSGSSQHDSPDYEF